jgi:hypothetical protein
MPADFYNPAALPASQREFNVVKKKQNYSLRGVVL